MSGGAWNYNRFDQYEQELQEKKADKDYDGDGKVESSKDEYFGSKDKAIKKAMGKDDKDDKKSSKKDDCECKEEYVDENRQAAYTAGQSDAKKSMKSGPAKATGGKTYTMKGKDGKPLFKEESISIVKEDVIDYILENELATNSVSAEVLFNVMSDEYLEDIEADIMEIYKGKHGQSEKEYQDGRSNAGKMISGDSKGSGANYSYKAKNTGPNPAGGSKRPQGQARMNNKDRQYLAFQKGMRKKG